MFKDGSLEALLVISSEKINYVWAGSLTRTVMVSEDPTAPGWTGWGREGFHGRFGVPDRGGSGRHVGDRGGVGVHGSTGSRGVHGRGGVS